MGDVLPSPGCDLVLGVLDDPHGVREGATDYDADESATRPPTSTNIILNRVLLAMVFAWSVLILIPWHDTPFAEYAADHATAKVEEFNSLLTRAADQVETGEEPTVFVALKRIINKERIDLLSFFPDINVSDIKNLDKRNDILLRELLRRSQRKLKLGLDLKGGVAFTFKVSEEDLSPEAWERAQQLSQAEAIIASRIDGMGVAEPIIRKKGDARIEVLMPGISTRDNPDAIESLQAPALLEFSTVHRTIRPPPPAGPNPARVCTAKGGRSPRHNNSRQVPPASRVTPSTRPRNTSAVATATTPIPMTNMEA